MTASTASVWTSGWTTQFTVPSPPAATKSLLPSRIRSRIAAVTSTSRERRTTSSPASDAAETSSGCSPEEGFKNIVPLLRAVDVMKKASIRLVLLQVLCRSARGAEPKSCSFCAGVAAGAQPPSAPVPALLEINLDELAAVDALTPAQRAQTALLIRYALAEEKDPLTSVEERTKTIIEWAKARGPFDAIGVHVQDADANTASYAIKRLAVMAQGLNVPSKIVALATPPAAALPYVDAIVTDDPAQTVAWVAENDPSKKVWAIVQPQSPNVFFDADRAYAAGPARAYVVTAAAGVLSAIPSLNQAFTGDWAYDSTSKIETLDAKGNKTDIPALAFVRGED